MNIEHIPSKYTLDLDILKVKSSIRDKRIDKSKIIRKPINKDNVTSLEPSQKDIKHKDIKEHISPIVEEEKILINNIDKKEESIEPKCLLSDDELKVFHKQREILIGAINDIKLRFPEQLLNIDALYLKNKTNAELVQLLEKINLTLKGPATNINNIQQPQHDKGFFYDMCLKAEDWLVKNNMASVSGLTDAIYSKPQLINIVSKYTESIKDYNPLNALGVGNADGLAIAELAYTALEVVERNQKAIDSVKTFDPSILAKYNTH